MGEPSINASSGVCEHGDHPAPARQIFCSPECAACETADCDPSQECAGICLVKSFHERLERAEALALEAIRTLGEHGFPQPARVEWRTGERDEHRIAHHESGCEADGICLCEDGSCEWSNEYGAMADIDVPAARALWTLGFAIFSISDEAVVVTVPEVSGG